MNAIQNPHLDGSRISLEGGPVGLLVLHGFTATTVEVQPLVEYLHSKRFTIRAPLLPGHGSQPEELNRVRWQQWVEAAEQDYLDLERSCEQVFLIGASMGGLTCLVLANKYPQAAGLLLYAPAVHIKYLYAARYLAPFRPMQPKWYAANSVPTRFPWQGYTVIPVRGAAQLYQMQQHVLRLLPDIRQPVRVYQGMKDATIDPEGARLLYDRIGSSDKQLIWLEDSPHTILLDGDFDRVASEALEFIREHGQD